MSARFVQVATFVVLLAFALLLMTNKTHSVPSFARQTELACSNCHTVFPELNSFGRLFKLNGYTLASEEAIESKGPKEQSILRLPKIPPFSAMVQTAYTHISKDQPGTQNGAVSFPQQFSFFFAGEITPNLGGFVQVTWDDQSSAFDFDLMDFRYSHQFEVNQRDLVLGLTLNNTPTVQDLWNSTPAWGFPYASSNIAPTPGVSPILSGGIESFEQSFAGLGAYSMYNNLLYGEFSVYKSVSHGAGHPPDSTSTNTAKGVAPYWRVVVQHQWPNLYLSGGTYGFSGRFYPTGITGQTNRFTDIAFDAQAMRPIGSTGNLTAHSTWIHEKRSLDADFAAGLAQQSSENLNMFKIDANYFIRARYGLSVGYFTTTGDQDTLAYTPAPVSGFSGGKPNSNGIILEIAYLPWLNTKLSLQYVIYSKFNGAKNNYDGFGRNASDNNTVYLLTWLAM